MKRRSVNRRSLLKSTVSTALLALASRSPFSGWIAPAQAEEKNWRHGLSLFGDLKYQPGFKHFEYVNADAPERRRGAAGRARHVRQFQHGGRRRQRHAGGRHRLHLRHAVGAGARRSLERIRTARRGGELSGRLLLGYLPAAPGSEMARRQAGHAGRCRSSRSTRSRNTVRNSAPISAMSSRSRRPASTRSPSHSMRRATANCRRSSASSTSCRRPGGKAPTRTARSATSARPRSSRRSAAAPTASRSSRPAATSSTSASRTTGARTHRLHHRPP